MLHDQVDEITGQLIELDRLPVAGQLPLGEEGVEDSLEHPKRHLGARVEQRRAQLTERLQDLLALLGCPGAYSRVQGAAGVRGQRAAGSALLGDRGCRELRRRPGRLPADRGEQVVEVPRWRRSTRRYAAKSDAVDAVHIARDALIQAHPGVVRRRGDREALRVLLTTRRNAVNTRIQTVNQLKALIVSAPEELGAELRGRGNQGPDQPLRRPSRPPDQIPGASDDRPILISWSHAGRWRSEAAFAALAGTSPIPASSGRVTRYRLNRRGDRQLNNALHTIAVVRLRDDPLTRAYAQRRTAQGKNPREIKRCLKRIIARQLYKLLERYDRPTVEVTHTT